MFRFRLVQRQIRPYLLLSNVRLKALTKLQYDTLYSTVIAFPVMHGAPSATFLSLLRFKPSKFF